MERYNIKFNDNTKKYLQIYNHIKDMILKKELKAHEKLQPIRKLSEFIGVNNTTVVKAYELLENEGYLIMEILQLIFFQYKILKVL